MGRNWGRSRKEIRFVKPWEITNADHQKKGGYESGNRCGGVKNRKVVYWQYFHYGTKEAGRGTDGKEGCECVKTLRTNGSNLADPREEK